MSKQIIYDRLNYLSEKKFFDINLSNPQQAKVFFREYIEACNCLLKTNKDLDYVEVVGYLEVILLNLAACRRASDLSECLYHEIKQNLLVNDMKSFLRGLSVAARSCICELEKTIQVIEQGIK